MTRAVDTVSVVAGANVDLTSGGTLLAEVLDPIPSVVAQPDLTVGWGDGVGVYGVTLEPEGDPANPAGQMFPTINSVAYGSTFVGSPTKGAPIRLGVSINDSDLSFADSNGAAFSITQYPQIPNLSRINIAAGILSAPTLGSASILRNIQHIPTRLSPAVFSSEVETSGPYSVVVNASSPGTIIPSNFVGLSMEKSSIVQSGGTTGTGALNSNTGLKNILGVLSNIPGLTGSYLSFRFGGNTCDTNTPATSRATNGAQFVASFGANATALWCVSWQIQLPSTTAAQQGATDAAEVAAVYAVLGSSAVFNIGNEPDFYSGASYSSFISQWGTIWPIITATTAMASCSGPDNGELSTSYTTQFMTSETGVCTLASKHLYPFYNAPAYGQKAAITAMWADSTADYNARYLKPLATTANMAVRMTESGTDGYQGIGNSLGGAMWELWEMVQLAQNGWAGVNFHNGNIAGAYGTYPAYAPVVLNADGATYTAQAPLYAMWMFNELADGAILPLTTNNLPKNVTALAVLGADSKVRVLLINQNATARALVNLGRSGTWTTASTLLLTAPSYASTLVSVNNTQIAASGLFSPLPYVVTASGGAAQIALPASSAAVVTLQ